MFGNKTKIKQYPHSKVAQKNTREELKNHLNHRLIISSTEKCFYKVEVKSKPLTLGTMANI